MLEFAAQGALTIREVNWAEPRAAFPRLAGEPHVVWLDSAPGYGGQSRMSYLAAWPFRVIAATPAGVTIDGLAVDGDPFAVVAAELDRWRLPPGAGPAPFIGGAVGWFGYGLRRHLETLPDRHHPAALADMQLGFYDAVLAFDHGQQRAWICSSGFPAAGAARAARAVARADEITALLGAPAPPALPAIPPLAWRPALGQGEYEDRVRQILALIRAGDIFQANFTTAFTAARPAGLSAAALYLALRDASPAPFGAFIDGGGGHALASASPERFVSLGASGRIEARPIKGTAARAADPMVDAGLRSALRGSAKDRAENLMITDLLRNDIGRVARLGSVAVETLGALESFANVHHLVSVITAELQPGLTAVDLLRAVFPGGSVTGAPKIRAMEIIDEMEVCARGAYCGAIAWLGFDGGMDSSIVIRTITLTPETLIAQAGGGIVADSLAAAEYAEMLLKIAPLLGLGG